MTQAPIPAGGAVEAGRKRNERVLILFARMERARVQGKTLRLTWKELDVLWTVFGSVMSPAAEWAFAAASPEKPAPDLAALLAEIAEAMAAEDLAARALPLTSKEDRT